MSACTLSVLCLCAALRVLRTHQQVIVGLLQAIVSDPFIEWTKSSAPKIGRNRLKPSGGGEDEANPRALAAMMSVQGKLQGVLAGGKLTPCRQMTVAAQVDYLLNECQDIDNLSRMYIGWLPFL
jgi:phosphatidylinositol kinase/protein kinase (PI-3  family)